MSLNPEEKALAARIGFDEDVLELVKADSDGPLVQLRGCDDEGEEEDKAGLFVSAPEEQSEEQQAEQVQLHKRLNDILKPRGYLVFIVARAFHLPLAVLKTSDHFDVLRAMSTNGANYDIGNAEVVQKLQDWDARYGIEIIGADFDTAMVELRTLPQDVRAFAEEVYEFCPDAVDQGTGGLYHEMDEAELTELGLEYDETLDEPEAGLQILTAHIQQSKSLFLWWD